MPHNSTTTTVEDSTRSEGGGGRGGARREGEGGFEGSKVTHQGLSGENLQQGNEVVAIAQVLIQVADVALRLKKRHN